MPNGDVALDATIVGPTEDAARAAFDDGTFHTIVDGLFPGGLVGSLVRAELGDYELSVDGVVVHLHKEVPLARIEFFVNTFGRVNGF
jgi:hypothetical protein